MNTKILDTGPPRRRATRPPGKGVEISAEKQQQLLADSSKSPSCSQSDPRAFENRQNWALCWPNSRKSQSWQADFSGVVSLNGEKHWVNVYVASGYLVRLKLKDNPKPDSWRCQLQDDGSRDRYTGTLQLDQQTFSVKLWEDAGCLRVHFELERDGE